jgi:trimeric autotransporter adhesin
MKPCIPAVPITFAVLCFTFSPAAQAVSPPPDGGYPGGNTAEGQTALQFLTSGVWNTAVGNGALFHDTTGNQNTATGYQTLFSNTTGNLSTAYGSQALYNNTTGNYDVATGFRTLYSNTSGSQNTAIGFEALNFNITGGDNTAIGFKALYLNTNQFQLGGSSNTAVGSQALYGNTMGVSNTAIGFKALYGNTLGISNTAIGQTALLSNTTGINNTAIGLQAIDANAEGSNNTGIGTGALSGSEEGDDNTATGVFALRDVSGSDNTADGSNALGHAGVGDANTAIGAGALDGQPTFSGSGNTALGSGAGAGLTEGDNNIYIGNPGAFVESGTVRIGTGGTQTQTFIAGISGTAVTGTAVVVDSNGQLGVAASSERFKDEIKPMNKVSEAILALKPVTFRYKKELDPKGAPQFGLIAEDVAKVSPDLVVADDQGKPFTVRYDQVNAMLLNEFLKEHRAVQEQKATIAQLKQDFQSKLGEQQKQIEALTVGLQKVSAEREASKPAPQVVNNNQ